MSRFKQYMDIINEMMVNKDMNKSIKSGTNNAKELREKSLQGMNVKSNNDDNSDITFNLNGKVFNMIFSRDVKDESNHYDPSNQRHYFYVSVNKSDKEKIDTLQQNSDFFIESSDYVGLIKSSDFKKILLNNKLSNSEIYFVINKILELMDNGAQGYDMFPE